MSAVQQDLFAAIEACFQDPEIRNRSYYPDFRRGWTRVFEEAVNRPEPYFDFTAPQCYTVSCDFNGINAEYHIDQLKICDWYEKELRSSKRIVFSGKKLRRSKTRGELQFHEAVCRYDPNAPEEALEDNMRNIIACALPRLPLSMEIVYGNKWVESRFGPLRRNRLDAFLIGTDYVPAFLGSAFEAALYLFLMDICIIKTNLGKAKDEDIRSLLHIMRPSPMLQIKGLYKGF